MCKKHLYNTPYHSEDLSQYKFLITGGAGFIGSNIVEYLIRYNAGHVRVLDNLSNGYFENIKDFIGLSNFEFIQGDIRNIDTCSDIVEGIDFISHQAALGSVPRSIKDPLVSHEVNVTGFLNMIDSARKSNLLKGFVYAASSSTYGDSNALPKKEESIGNPLSPYAVTKYVNELYADVYSKVYDFKSIGLRYFNVFGPKQSPDNPYAAVIPLFMKAALSSQRPIINGDGTVSRDFTFVENAVQANIKAFFNSVNIERHEVFNIACGKQTDLNKLWSIIASKVGISIIPTYGPQRPGDIKASLADISKAQSVLQYKPNIDLELGLELTLKAKKEC